MGQIRIFNRPPKAFEFDKEDLVIDNVGGDIYYKDDKNRLQKIVTSQKSSTDLTLNSLNASTLVSSTTISGSSQLIAGNITASGNISASGTIIANNFQSDGQDQITVADAFNITGSITSSGDISASGEVSAGTIVVGSTITHIGDSNTKITFSNDDINLTAAGKTAIDITYDGNGGGDTREITFNEGHADIDVRIEGDTDANLFFTDAGNEKVGIGTGTPGEKLEVIGNISASGNMIANTGSFNIIEGGVF